MLDSLFTSLMSLILCSASSGPDSGAYSIITGVTRPVPINEKFAKRFAVPNNEPPDFKMLDSRAQAFCFRVSGDFATFTGFTALEDTSQWQRIDFVFGGSNSGWTAGGYKVETSLTDDGTLASDHRPVFADITF